MQIFIIFSVAILTTVTSQLFFKKGMMALGRVDLSLHDVYLLIAHIFSNYFLLAGIFLYAISFLMWLFILSKVKLSIAYPITSMNFVLVLLFSYFIYDEKLTLFQYGGVVFIIMGIFLLSAR
jgi:drug/metabolite transporter (DMT)-like permease